MNKNDIEKCKDCPIRFECEDNAERYSKNESEEHDGELGTEAGRVQQ